MENRINIIALLTIAVIAIVSLSLGLIIPAIFSTDLIPFFLIVIIEAVYIAGIFLFVGYLVKKIIHNVKQSGGGIKQ
jgi:hypothetical protein